jgi:hypothetical protein
MPKKPGGVLQNVINKLLKPSFRNLHYIVALLPYLYFERIYWESYNTTTSLSSYIAKAKEDNVKYTLTCSFNREVAEKTFRTLEGEIHEPLDKIKSRVEPKKIVEAIREGEKRCLKVSREILPKAVENRLNTIFTSERRSLITAGLIITLTAMGVQILPEPIRVVSDDKGYVIVELEQSLAKAAKVLLNREIPDPEYLLYRCLLAFRGDTYIIDNSVVKNVRRIVVIPTVKYVIPRLSLEALHNKDIAGTVINSALNQVKARGCLYDLKQLCLDMYLRATLIDLEATSIREDVKSFIKKLLDLKNRGKIIITYHELVRQEFANFNIRILDRFLNKLIRLNVVRAKYIGPEPGKLPKECHGVNYSDDPWSRNRVRSGEIKIWLLESTRNKKLRKKRRKCWKHYIELDFSKLYSEVEKYCEAKNLITP